MAKGERIFDGIFKMIYALAPSLGSLSLYHCNDQFQKDGGEESPTRCNKHMGANEIQRS